MYEKEILSIYQKCNITSFPFDCNDVFAKYKYRTSTYIERSKSTHQLRALQSYSSDAFTDYNTRTVFYNDAISNRRIRFSLMHELGHIVLETDDDRKADAFASSFLAPRPIIYALKLRNAQEISDRFDISISAANHVANEMHVSDRDWYFPDIYGTDIIEYFGYRPRCPELFPEPPKEALPSPAQLPPIEEKTKTKDEILKFRKQKRSLEGKIKRARLRMMEAQDEATYEKYKKKVWENEIRLNWLLDKDPFEDFR